MRPQTKYGRSGDIHVAYQVSGDDPIDVVWAPGTASHLDLDWDLPDAKGRPTDEVRDTRDDITRRVAELVAELDAS